MTSSLATLPIATPRVPDFEAIPPDLTCRPQWVVWREEHVPGRDNATKPPYSPITRQRADVSDPTTWATFEQARAAYEDGAYDGVGYVLTADDGIVGWDVDGCRNASTGVVNGAADHLIALLDSYTEVSPSGEGIRIFTRGTLPSGGNRKGTIEVYDRARYLTVTGGVSATLVKSPIAVTKSRASTQQSSVAPRLSNSAT